MFSPGQKEHTTYVIVKQDGKGRLADERNMEVYSCLYFLPSSLR